MIQEAIRKAVEGVHLTEDEAAAAMEAIMEGEATPAQIAAFITALRIKGETVDEIAGCARVMREKAAKITPRRTPLVDTCGTGGDGANTFNISTAAAFVAAAAGAAVAKHGNRSVSSRCGSADVLEALGVRIDLTPDAVRECIDQVGIGFLFAPLFHSSMRHAVGPRKEIGIRSVFNVLGPLTNPASAQAQVVGVYDAALTEPLARVLGRLSVREAYVVHGQPRLDEISISGETQVSHLKDGEVHTFRIRPEDAGLKTWPAETIAGGDAQHNAAIIRSVLKGKEGPQRDVVLLNAAAALLVAGLAKDLMDGVARAAESIDRGRAYEKLEALIEFTRSRAA
ncbi:MAG: anthranilate phosphoribosyltransferase [Firmicutes bacterium]|nr:anthranilate phosphoribosyltransferase [Bacillota bacterium]